MSALTHTFATNLKMSESSVDSTIGEQNGRNYDDRHKSSIKIKRCLKTFFCCFKREPRAKEIVKYDSDEYDYIVEKLVVKRVPLALFAIPSDLQDRCWQTPSTSSQSTSLSTVSENNSTVNAVTQTLSTKSTIDRTVYDSMTSKALRFDKDENQVPIWKSLNCEPKSSVWQEQTINRFNASHPDFRKFKESFKDILNRQSFAEDISKMTSNSGTDIFSRSTSLAVIQNDVSIPEEPIHHSKCFFGFASKRNEKSRLKENDNSRQLQDAPFGKVQDNLILGWNRRYVVSPFQVKRRSFDLAKPQNIVKDSVDGKSLEYIEESIKDKCTKLAEDPKESDSRSKAAVRWRITIRHRCADASSKPVASEV